MRRIGSTPQERGSMNGQSCPDVIELDDGAFLVIGKHRLLTESESAGLREQGASIGDDEQAVIVPRDAFLTAARQLVAEDAGEAEGRDAYAAYGFIIDVDPRRQREGSTMTPWDELPNNIKAGWINAVMGVRNRALMEAADKIRKGTDPDCNCGGCDSCAQRVAAASIDPRDPRSLDGDQR